MPPPEVLLLRDIATVFSIAVLGTTVGDSASRASLMATSTTALSRLTGELKEVDWKAGDPMPAHLQQILRFAYA